MGKEKQKVLPSPNLDLNHIFPPLFLIIAFEIKSPNPEPEVTIDITLSLR